MINRVIRRSKQLRQAAITHFVWFSRRLETQHHVPPSPPTPSAVVRAALNLSPASLGELNESVVLKARLANQKGADNVPASREIFLLDGVPLPCWQETDIGLYDDWLTDSDYYPAYYALFQALTRPEQTTRFLEIGVRTGYMGVTFAKAARGPCLYMGIDPNLYVRQGLQLASETFKILRATVSGTEFVLIEGYSWDQDIQKSLVYSGPFDIVHIDGDHTLTGKLIDLELARRLVSQDGLILVDDYDHHSIVSDAIKRACKLGWFTEFAYLPTKRGLAVLR